MAAKIEIVHATSPLCHWSWGYEPVINRIELLYGNQVNVTIGQAIPHTDRNQWLVDYGMTKKEAMEFVQEIVAAIQLPVHVPASYDETPMSALPVAVAAKAAGIAYGPKAERKLTRNLQFAAYVEGLDTAQEDVIAQVIRDSGFDLDRVLKAAGDDATKALEEDAQKLGHGANFFSLLVRDNDLTTVTLEQAYDASRVERAIDYIAGKKLKKREPKDIVGYVAEHGPVPIREIATVFALTPAKAKSTLIALEKKGDLVRKTYPLLPKDPFWVAAE